MVKSMNMKFFRRSSSASSREAVFPNGFLMILLPVYKIFRASHYVKKPPSGIRNVSSSPPGISILIPDNIKNSYENHLTNPVNNFHNLFSKNVFFSTKQL